MKEFEVKLRLASIPDLSRYEFLGEAEEEDVYFQHPCRDFSKTDEALRIRIRKSSREEILITYKGPREPGRVKIREEIEFPIPSREEAEKILIKLGFKPVARIKKRRRAYRVGNAYVTIDEVEDLGLFMEIEASSEEEVINTRRSLGVEAEEEKRTYLELFLLHHGHTLRDVDEEVDESY